MNTFATKSCRKCLDKMLPRTSPHHMNSLGNVPRYTSTHAQQKVWISKEAHIFYVVQANAGWCCCCCCCWSSNFFFITIFLSIKLLFWKCESFEFWFGGARTLRIGISRVHISMSREQRMNNKRATRTAFVHIRWNVLEPIASLTLYLTTTSTLCTKTADSQVF